MRICLIQIFQNKKLIYIILGVFLLCASIFLYVAEKYEINPLSIERAVTNSLYFKFSSEDIMALKNSVTTDKWISVKLIENPQIIHSVKLKPNPISILDFQLNIKGTVYNLFQYAKSRKYIFKFFQTAKNWDIDSTSPQLVKMKINEIILGIYIMEKKIYEKIRDNKGNYFISLGSNTERMRTLLYLLPIEREKILTKYFNKKELAAYFVFFSLFSYDEILYFDQLIFRYDAKMKKFQPFLTLESVLLSLNVQNKKFKMHLEDKKNFFKNINEENINNLLKRAHHYKYEDLIRMVLQDKIHFEL